MEELIPIAFPVFGGTPYNADPIEPLRADAAPIPHQLGELVEMGRDALGADGLELI